MKTAYWPVFCDKPFCKGKVPRSNVILLKRSQVFTPLKRNFNSFFNVFSKTKQTGKKVAYQTVMKS